MADKTTAGEVVRTLRTLAGLTLDEVAAMARTSPAYISRVENGHAQPTPQWVGNVTAAIGAALAGPRAAA